LSEKPAFQTLTENRQCLI